MRKLNKGLSRHHRLSQRRIVLLQGKYQAEDLGGEEAAEVQEEVLAAVEAASGIPAPVSK